jgi:hypothetical protein
MEWWWLIPIMLVVGAVLNAANKAFEDERSKLDEESRRLDAYLDDDDDDARPSTLGRMKIGQALIDYVDVDGVCTTREIGVLSLGDTPAGNEAFTAFCRSANDLRTFRLDRIEQMTDLATGEVLNDQEDYRRWAGRNLGFERNG